MVDSHSFFGNTSRIEMIGQRLLNTLEEQRGLGA
jgi:hypothetical protein